MRFNIQISKKANDQISHVAVMALLAVAVIASYGCGSETPRREMATTETTTPRYTYETVARTETVPAVSVVAEPVVMTTVKAVPVTYEDAEAAYRDGRFLEAVELFDGYVEAKPENPWGFYMLGLSARMAGDAETSIASFERSLVLAPNHLKSHINLARVLLGEERFDEAGGHLDHALLLDPESNDAYRLLGRLSSETGDTDGAIDAFEHALVINEWDSWSMNNLGLVFIRQGEFEKALLPLARANEIRDSVAVFQNNLGMALERLGYFEEATTAYQIATSSDPTHVRAKSNFDRLSGRVNNPGVEPINLEQIAQDFVADIISWRTGLADVPPIEPIIEVDVADTTPPLTSDSTVAEVTADTTRTISN
jgi:Flp pilus assembly protein TadD